MPDTLYIVLFKPDHMQEWTASPTVYRDLPSAKEAADQYKHDRCKSRIVSTNDENGN